MDKKDEFNKEHIQPQKDLELQLFILTEMFPQRRGLRDVRSEKNTSNVTMR